MKKLLLLSLLFSWQAYAQDYANQDYSYELSAEELNPPTEEILIKKPEKYLRDESMIYDLNTDLGIRDQRQYTGTDKKRLSLAGHINGQYEHVQDLLGIDFTYMRRSDRYDRIWWGFQVFQHRTQFDAVAEKQVDEAAGRPNDSKGTMFGAGLGVSYRFKLLLDFIPTENWFENIDVFANYINYHETFVDKNYIGWGLTTSYGLIRRTSTNFYWGPKLSYSLAPVRRERLDSSETTKRSREMTLGWISAALEIGFFY